MFLFLSIGFAEPSTEERMEEPGLDEDDSMEAVRYVPLVDDEVDIGTRPGEERVVQVLCERVSRRARCRAGHRGW